MDRENMFDQRNEPHAASMVHAGSKEITSLREKTMESESVTQAPTTQSKKTSQIPTIND